MGDTMFQICAHTLCQWPLPHQVVSFMTWVLLLIIDKYKRLIQIEVRVFCLDALVHEYTMWMSSSFRREGEGIDNTMIWWLLAIPSLWESLTSGIFKPLQRRRRTHREKEKKKMLIRSRHTLLTLHELSSQIYRQYSVMNSVYEVKARAIPANITNYEVSWIESMKEFWIHLYLYLPLAHCSLIFMTHPANLCVSAVCIQKHKKGSNGSYSSVNADRTCESPRVPTCTGRVSGVRSSSSESSERWLHKTALRWKSDSDLCPKA